MAPTPSSSHHSCRVLSTCSNDKQLGAVRPCPSPSHGRGCAWVDATVCLDPAEACSWPPPGCSGLLATGLIQHGPGLALRRRRQRGSWARASCQWSPRPWLPSVAGMPGTIPALAPGAVLSLGPSLPRLGHGTLAGLFPSEEWEEGSFSRKRPRPGVAHAGLVVAEVPCKEHSAPALNGSPPQAGAASGDGPTYRK